MVSYVELLILIAIIFYILGTAGYLAYLFLQKNHFQQTGYYLLAGGFLFQTIAIAYGFVQSGHIPVTNLAETLCVAGMGHCRCFSDLSIQVQA